eukprot:6212488-Pleurochrysis_carterae.AAC.5
MSARPVRREARPCVAARVARARSLYYAGSHGFDIAGPLRSGTVKSGLVADDESSVVSTASSSAEPSITYRAPKLPSHSSVD